jgi:Protein of unknown function (DUF2809)
MNKRLPARNRMLQGAAFLAVIGLGLLSRSHRIGLPPFWAKYSGDALWALMVFVLFGLLFPHRTTLFVGCVAMAYSCTTEFSQLYHAPWIDSARRQPLGHLVLGDTFAWADMAAYFVGIIVGVAIEQALQGQAVARGRGAAP